MPYINAEYRKYFDPLLEDLLVEIKRSNWEEAKEGIVNYCITRIINNLYGRNGYADFNRAIGILECVKQEFYRRCIAPYEDWKKGENGDVFD